MFKNKQVYHIYQDSKLLDNDNNIYNLLGSYFNNSQHHTHFFSDDVIANFDEGKLNNIF